MCVHVYLCACVYHVYACVLSEASLFSGVAKSKSLTFAFLQVTSLVSLRVWTEQMSSVIGSVHISRQKLVSMCSDNITNS